MTEKWMRQNLLLRSISNKKQKKKKKRRGRMKNTSHRTSIRACAHVLILTSHSIFEYIYIYLRLTPSYSNSTHTHTQHDHSFYITS